MGGSSEIVVGGTSFLNATSLRCRLLSSNGNEKIIEANFVSSSLVRCLVPPLSTEFVEIVFLSLTNNGKDYDKFSVLEIFIPKLYDRPFSIFISV